MLPRTPSILFVPLLVAGGTLYAHAGEDAGHPISTRVWHLGNDLTDAWPEAPADPEGGRIDVPFEGRAFAGEGLLSCQQRHVNNAWHIEINGARIATLDRTEALGEHFYEIPAGTIQDGPNTFTLVGDTPTDDITFGAIRYYPYSYRQLKDLRRVHVHVNDDRGQPLPARVTITDASGAMVRLYYAEKLTTAVRDGIVYTSNGVADFEVGPGTYTVHAARGTEWSMAKADVTVDGKDHSVHLSLRREVDTAGFVAADTHIHTLTHSGHGDSSVEERMVTLAGEGVELAIATDHNHNTDYRPTQSAMGLNAHFMSVVGNEVTTPIGHLNGFPLDPKDEVPTYHLRDVVKIVEGIREKGALAVILNHPRWPDHQDSPHGHIRLDHPTGDWIGSWACPFDAVELINSETEEPDPWVLFKDWFALLNRGERVFAVGSSDSHTVGGVVGQGRTYVQSHTDVPAQIDVHQASHNIADGHSSISMGLFVDARHRGRSVLGQTLPLAPFGVRIAAPSWARPKTLTVFANGVAIMKRRLPSEADEPFDRTFTVPTDLAWPKHDCWMVAVVEGDGVREAAWPQLNDYTLAATNPVFVDMNGDGVYTHPRALAARRMAGVSPVDTAAITRVLADVDGAVGDQVRRLYHRFGLDVARWGAQNLPNEMYESARLGLDHLPVDAEVAPSSFTDPEQRLRIELGGRTRWIQGAGVGDKDPPFTVLRARAIGQARVPGAAEGARLDVLWIPRDSGTTAWDETLGRAGARRAPVCPVVSADDAPGWLWIDVGPREVLGLVVFADPRGERALFLRADPCFSQPATVLANAARMFRVLRQR